MGVLIRLFCVCTFRQHRVPTCTHVRESQVDSSQPSKHSGCKTCLTAWSTVQDNSGRLLKHMASATDDLDALFTELDLNLTNSRRIFSQIPDSGPPSTAAPASYAADHIQTVPQEQQQQATAGLEVPAYVHVGDPLITEQAIAKEDVDIAAVDW